MARDGFPVNAFGTDTGPEGEDMVTGRLQGGSECYTPFLPFNFLGKGVQLKEKEEIGPLILF